jgi:hypothetical protein
MKKKNFKVMPGSKKMSIISSLRAKSFPLLYKISYISHNLQTYGNNTIHLFPADAYIAGRGCLLESKLMKKSEIHTTIKSYCDFDELFILCFQRPLRFMYFHGIIKFSYFF